MNFLLFKILWLRRSKWQFLFAGIAMLLGMTIILSALEIYWNIQSKVAEQKKKGQFLIVNKKISLANTLGLASSAFTKDEIEKLKNAPHVRSVGFLESNHFQASIRATQIIDFSTYVFFETLPKSFLDEQSPDFHWKEGEITVPIIVSQDFLNLYNFGFALSQKLPQVSREALKMVPFEVVVSGPGGEQVFDGQVVGFTERISSVLVPKKFMDWANKNIAQKSNNQPSRAILKVDDISDPVLSQFLSENKLASDREKMQLGKTGTFLQTFMEVAASLGILFMALAFIMFNMNFRLILAEATQDIKLLVELGYRHLAIGGHLVLFFAVFLFLIFGLTGLLMYESHQYIQHILVGQGLDLTAKEFPLRPFFTGLGFTLGILVLNVLLIQRQLVKIR